MKTKLFVFVVTLFLTSFLFLGVTTKAEAATQLYVDPDYTGSTRNGSASNPWLNLSSTEWATINSLLTNDDVTVYFSARSASSAANQTSANTLNILRTNTSSYRVTLDGMSFYNTNDTSPNWVQNTGNYKHQIQNTYPIQTGSTNRDYVTIRGFKSVATVGQAFYYWGGSHLIIENNEFTQTAQANTVGPLFIFDYAYRASGSGNGGNTDITIRNNSFHDSYGECLYMGGVENTGKIGYQGILIENNTVSNCGIIGAEGDGIDIKDGNTNVVIRGNLITNTYGGNHHGISAHSAITAEKNVISGTNYGISLSGFWGASISGSRITGNLIFNDAVGIVLDNGHSPSGAIPMDNTQITNNTIVNSTGAGINLNNYSGLITNVVIKNNIIFGNAGSGIGGSSAVSGLSISYNDVFSNNPNYSGAASGKQVGDISVNPVFANSSNPLGADGVYFTSDDGFMLSSSSPACSGGENGTSIGAYSCISSPTTKTGDLNNDNKVDIFDYNILVGNFGKTGTGIAGDIDRNGKVDIFDYNALVGNFGK